VSVYSHHVHARVRVHDRGDDAPWDRIRMLCT
jgi:hypothetical protein